MGKEVSKEVKEMSKEGKKRIKKYIKGLKLDKDVSPKKFKEAMRSAYKDRAAQVYFIWKAIKELYPDVDADKVVREGSWNFGLWQGNKIAEQYGAENIGPVEAVIGQSSKGGFMIFEQELLELEDDKAVKMFHWCPHVALLKEMGESKETIKKYCRDIVGQCDYAICQPFPNVEINFPTTLADGKGKGCAMTITRKK